MPLINCAPTALVRKPFICTFSNSFRYITVLPLGFLKYILVVAVVLRLVKSVESTLDANDAKICSIH